MSSAYDYRVKAELYVYDDAGNEIEYEYTRYKNETDSTMMYEYYYYVVEYYIDGVLVNDEPITFYETRTFI